MHFLEREKFGTQIFTLNCLRQSLRNKYRNRLETRIVLMRLTLVELAEELQMPIGIANCLT